MLEEPKVYCTGFADYECTEESCCMKIRAKEAHKENLIYTKNGHYWEIRRVP